MSTNEKLLLAALDVCLYQALNAVTILQRMTPQEVSASVAFIESRQDCLNSALEIISGTISEKTGGEHA